MCNTGSAADPPCLLRAAILDLRPPPNHSRSSAWCSLQSRLLQLELWEWHKGTVYHCRPGIRTCGIHHLHFAHLQGWRVSLWHRHRICMHRRRRRRTVEVSDVHPLDRFVEARRTWGNAKISSLTSNLRSLARHNVNNRKQLRLKIMFLCCSDPGRSLARLKTMPCFILGCDTYRWPLLTVRESRAAVELRCGNTIVRHACSLICSVRVLLL